MKEKITKFEKGPGSKKYTAYVKNKQTKKRKKQPPKVDFFDEIEKKKPRSLHIGRHIP